MSQLTGAHGELLQQRRMQVSVQSANLAVRRPCGGGREPGAEQEGATGLVEQPDAATKASQVSIVIEAA